MDHYDHHYDEDEGGAGPTMTVTNCGDYELYKTSGRSSTSINNTGNNNHNSTQIILLIPGRM